MNNKAMHLIVTSEQDKRIEKIREIFSTVYDELETLCISSRETSIAMTKLEEAQFWAIKGISRE